MKILYIDMDGVIADFDGAIKKLCPEIIDMKDVDERSKKVDSLCEANTDIFHNLEPIEAAIGSVRMLSKYYEIYFLSTPMWNVPNSFTGKRLWLEKYFGEFATKRLILTHRKDLNQGDYLVDDRIKNGVDKFKGEHIHFATAKYPGWDEVNRYLLAKAKGYNYTTESKPKLKVLLVSSTDEKEYLNNITKAIENKKVVSMSHSISALGELGAFVRNSCLITYEEI